MWTRLSDFVSEYVCRVLNHMRDTGTTVATPALADPASLEEENVFDFSSGYIQRSLHIMPKSTATLPWRLSQNYVQDRIDMRTGAIADGVRSEEHTSELQSLMRIPYAVFCLNKKKTR